MEKYDIWLWLSVCVIINENIGDWRGSCAQLQDQPLHPSNLCRSVPGEVSAPSRAAVVNEHFELAVKSRLSGVEMGCEGSPKQGDRPEIAAFQ